MKYYFSDSIGDTPAMVDRETGDVYLNSNTWHTLSTPFQAFILEHETGHYKLQTTNELKADAYAFGQIAGKQPESLKNTVRVLFDVLPYTSPAHKMRLLNISRLAFMHDYAKQPTPERLQEIRAIEADLIKDFSRNTEFMDYILSKQKAGDMPPYEFPGYAPNQFEPSTGRWFRDFQINKTTQPVPWPVTRVEPQNTGNASINPANKPVAKSPGTTIVEAVQVELLPEFGNKKLTLDLKTVLIVFVAVALISILNKI